MPIFGYRAVASGCEHCEAGFDLLEKLDALPTTVCPKCGAAVARQLSAPALAMGGSHLLQEKRIGDKGFTQYRKIEHGVYEKTAGKGPDIIKK